MKEFEADGGNGTGETPQANAAYFDGLAGRWDELMGLDARTSLVIEKSLDALEIREGARVLDPGCGTGVLFPFLLRRAGREGRLVGIDVSPSMLREAKRKFPDAPVRLVEGDVGAYLEESPVGSFDAIACFQAFPHFDGHEGVLSGFARVLAKGGRFVVFHADSSADVNAFHGTLEHPVRAHVLPSAAALASMAIDAGFRIEVARDEPGLYLVVGEKIT